MMVGFRHGQERLPDGLGKHGEFRATLLLLENQQRLFEIRIAFEDRIAQKFSGITSQWLRVPTWPSARWYPRNVRCFHREISGAVQAKDSVLPSTTAASWWTFWVVINPPAGTGCTALPTRMPYIIMASPGLRSAVENLCLAGTLDCKVKVPPPDWISSP